MILAAAVVLGLVGSAVRYRRDTFHRVAAIPLRSAWLVLLAIVMQWPLLWAPAGPVQELRVQTGLFLASYVVLLAFVWRNRRLAAILIVGVGVIGNLLVVAANGGFMPITPQTLTRINPGTTVEQWPEGVHYGHSKDVIRAQEHTRLWVLSDILVVPRPFPWPTAFSPGDLAIALGIVGLLQAPRVQVKPSQEKLS
jgi:hypothetical protein